MRFILIAIKLIFLISCIRNKEELIIHNKTVTIGDPIEIEIKNSGDNKFFFILGKNQLSYIDRSNFLVGHLFNKKDSLKVDEVIVSTVPFFTSAVQEKKYNKEVQKKKQDNEKINTYYKVLGLKKNLKLHFIFENYEVDEINGNEFRISLDNNQVYNLQLSYTSDSVLVKKQLPVRLLDSLHKNNIKIFHGTIYSNIIPLKFKK